MVKFEGGDEKPGDERASKSTGLETPSPESLSASDASTPTTVAEYDDAVVTTASEQAATSRLDSSGLGDSIELSEVSPPATDSDATPEAEDPDDEGDSKEGEQKRFTLHALGELVHDLLIAVIVCIFLIAYVVQAFKVQGSSMSPSLVNGERILVNKFVYRFGDIERGDIVVFWYPEDPELSFIKRIVGLPGEIVEIRNGEVFIDGEAQGENYVHPSNEDARNMTPREVRPGHYFVLGDNRSGSNDSRSWGYVPERYVYGKAFLRLWPIGSAGLLH